MRLKVFFLRKEILELLIYININFDNLLDILRDSNYSFNFFCITETWCTDLTLEDNTNLHLPNFDTISQERKQTNAAVVC